MSIEMYKLIFYTIFLLVIHISSANFYSSMWSMKPVLKKEGHVLKILKDYSKSGKTSNIAILSAIGSFEKHHKTASQPDFLLHIFNAHSLISKLTVELNELIRLIEQNGDIVVVRNIQHLELPNEEDYEGSLRGILRTQNTLRISAAETAKGTIKGHPSAFELTAKDCFELGKICFNEKKHHIGISWFEEALRRDKHNRALPLTEVYDLLQLSNFQIGELSNALYWSYKFLAIDPENQVALNNKKYYENTFKSLRNIRFGKDNEIEVNLQHVEPYFIDKYEIYDAGCRGSLKMPANKTKNLKCYYVTDNHPFLKIAPIKMEELHKNPYIRIFHDVLYDSEIDILKNESVSNLKIARVNSPDNTEGQLTMHRICKLSSVPKYEIPEVLKRISDFTKLSVESSENFQVINYGVGGHYYPHYDFSREHEDHILKYYGTGNRIASLIFYLSDVEEGGGTSFVYPQIVVQPKKGSALLWYNLHSSGHRDFRSLHAACPVFVGDKWIATMWFHENGQEFKRPCGLTEEADE